MNFEKLSAINVNEHTEDKNGLTKIKDKNNGKFIKKHGMKNTKIYRIWCSMKERCNNKNNKSYKNYGGRGIKVCDEWLENFISFYNWAIKNGYKEGLTIDRINNNGIYEPSNCRWITRKEQNRNYRKNHLLTYKGETLCLADMADKYGINRGTLLYRLKKGKTIEEALNE